MYSDLLVPVDRGYSSNEMAAREAAELAERMNATVHGLFVCVEKQKVGANEELTVSETEPIKKLEEFLDEWDVTVETTVAYGEPSAEICEYAEAHDIDAIVMSTHGRTGFRRWALGSVTEKTIRGAPCPVLAMTASDEGEAAD